MQILFIRINWFFNICKRQRFFRLKFGVSCFRKVPDSQCEVHRGNHGKASDGDEDDEKWRQEVQFGVIEQTKCPETFAVQKEEETFPY